MRLERDEIVITECVLRLYPRICQAMTQREEYLKAFLHPQQQYAKPVDGGQKIAEQDRYLSRLEDDKQYAFMHNIVRPIQKKIAELTHKEQLFIEYVYFRDMPFPVAAKQLGCSVTYVNNLRFRCAFALKKVCIDVYKDAYTWREKDSSERIEHVKC